MWKPKESLDDYVATPVPEAVPEPPRAVSLMRTGEAEILKPLARPAAPAKSVQTVFKPSRRSVVPQPLWFRRFLAVGSGALVLIALVLVSAILVGIHDPAAVPDVATNVQPDDNLTQLEEPTSFDVSSTSSFAPAIVGSEIVLPIAKRRLIRPHVELAPYRPRQYAPQLQIAEPKFFPTTLVIYSENGVIKTRIEPWLQSS